MRGFLAVFEREIAERRLLAPVALALGLLTLAAPLLPGVPAVGAEDLRSGMAVGLALAMSLILALILGGSVISRDLAEKRLGFYFSRPLSGWAVWAGKLSAAAALALGSGILVVLPAVLVGGGLGLIGKGDLFLGPVGLAIGWVVLALLFVLVGHAAGVILRSRSAWLTLDVAGLAVVGGLGWAAARRLLAAGAVGAAEILSVYLVLLSLAALTAAGAVQVIRGRTDARRGHRLLSLTLWGTLLAGILAAQGWASWILAVDPEDLESVQVVAVDPYGPWVAVFGPAKSRFGYSPEFLLNVDTGRAALVQAPVSGLWFRLRFSADGRWAAWLEPEGGSPQGPFNLFRPERTRTAVSDLTWLIAISSDGHRVALGSDRRITVAEVPSGRLLATGELPRNLGSYRDSLLFVGAERLRVYGGDLFEPDARYDGENGAFEIGELPVAGGRIVRVGRIEQVDDPNVSRDGSRILAFRRGDHRAVLFDGATGATLGELPPSEELENAYFLADGRIALTSGSQDKELRIFSPDLTPERSFRFAGTKAVRLGGQPSPDHLVVMTARRGPGPAVWSRGQTLLLDLGTGAMRSIGQKLEPVGPSFGPESAGSRTFVVDGKTLVVIDPATGRPRIALPRPPSPPSPPS
jgi:hypothetical protein